MRYEVTYRKFLDCDVLHKIKRIVEWENDIPAQISFFFRDPADVERFAQDIRIATMVVLPKKVFVRGVLVDVKPGDARIDVRYAAKKKDAEIFKNVTFKKGDFYPGKR